MNDSGMSFLLRLAVAYCAILLALAGLAGFLTVKPFALVWQRARNRRFPARRI